MGRPFAIDARSPTEIPAPGNGSDASTGWTATPTTNPAEGRTTTPRSDETFMQIALDLAARGRGRTSPNPMVGCVIVNDGEIVGQGWHERAGAAHAEVNALRAAGDRARGATVYVTLEPCSHHGRTPPCTDALIEAGVARVVAAHTDPNPQVAGRGFAQLRAAGIDVRTGVLAGPAAVLNETYIHWMRTGQPFVWWKAAISLDGRIATRTGDSRWITGPEARAAGHALRNELDAIMVGIGTVLADDPELTCRLPGGRDPVVVICDSLARTPPTARVFSRAGRPVYIAVTPAAPLERVAALQARGARMLYVPAASGATAASDAATNPPAITATSDPTADAPATTPAASGATADAATTTETSGGVDVTQLLTALGQLQITSVLLEGGASLTASLIARGLVSKAWLFIAPKLIGGDRAPGPVGGNGAATMAAAQQWRFTRTQPVGEDVLLEAYPVPK